ncbi:MAG: CIA30 family protein [Rhodospirillaceae bacterium]|nr:CIA30 family protein [Rhodospirillaceae bacterium]|tara:strand:- start:126 stop:632 length:507 start_codon:yes stop_codon:yes gene_type:complete
MLIDDFTDEDLNSRFGNPWRGVSDKVMGGVSEPTVSHEVVKGRSCLRLTGNVCLENDGGFIQAALDLTRSGKMLNVSQFSGVRITVRGNGERYSIHLRTSDNKRPWQSYRAQFIAGLEWETVDLPFVAFEPHRLDLPFDKTRLRRIGFVAIGRAFSAELLVAELAFYR